MDTYYLKDLTFFITFQTRKIAIFKDFQITYLKLIFFLECQNRTTTFITEAILNDNENLYLFKICLNFVVSAVIRGNDCKKKQGPLINKPKNPNLNSLIKLHSLTPQDIQFLM